jgi:hypothetical protein
MTTMISASKEASDFKALCPGYDPIMTTIPAEDGRRIIAIGDTHGDWKTTLALLKVAGLVRIDKHGEPHWDASPPDTILVQLGDQIDRCRPGRLPCAHKDATHGDEASDTRIIHLFTHLDTEARRVGGAVYSILGNHELMNVYGDIRYVSRMNLDLAAKNAHTRDGESARKNEFAPGGEIARKLACTRSSVLIIGGTLFAHAGVVEGLLKEFPAGHSIAGIRWFNTEVRRWLLGQITAKNITAIINSMKISPFWNRILGKIPPGLDKSDPTCQEHLAPVFRALKIGKMVVGHTPQLDNNTMANTTCSDSLVRVDIGASQAFEGIDGHGARERPAQVAEIIVGGDIRILKNSYQ